MSTLNLIITTAGQAALAQAGTLGPVVISKVAIGSGTWSTAPTASATALHTQIKQLDPSGSSTPSAGITHITATDGGTDAYNVYEMALYTSTGVLFAIAGGTTLFLTKATSSSALFSIDLAITNVPSGDLVIGDTGFSYPQATETVKGVAEIATTAEVTAGTDDTRIVTPLKLAGKYLSKSGGTVTGTLNVAGTFQNNGVTIYNLYSIIKTRLETISGWVGYKNTNRQTYTATWYNSSGFTHLTDTITVPAGETWEVDYITGLSRDTDDYVSYAILLNDVVEFDIGQTSWGAYSRTTYCYSKVFTAGTYVIKFKTLLSQGSGYDEINFNPSYGNIRSIRKYKTA